MQGSAEAGRVHAVGIDLAWGNNPSGVAHLSGPVPGGGGRGGWRLLETAHVGSHAAVAAWVGNRVGDHPVWIGIDAPLAATNPEATLRPCEHSFRHDFLRFRVSCYPTDPKKAARSIAVRQELERMGITFAAPGPDTGDVRRGVFETFPTAAQLSLFERRRPIRYKHGDVANRRDGLRSVQLALAQLDDASLPLEDTTALRELLSTEPRTLAGARLKGLEDRLDALICALVAALAWRAPTRLKTYGDTIHGAITVPHPPPAP